MAEKRCDICSGDLGFMYFITRKGYNCLNCREQRHRDNEQVLSLLPDVEDLPPVDGKYRSGILAPTEKMAEALCNKYYDLTPAMNDWEN